MNNNIPIIEKGRSCNVVFESPHQGRDVPEALRHHAAMTTIAAHRCDTHIDRVAEMCLKEVGGTLLHSPVSRMVVDLNRGADRVDARVCPTWPGARVYDDGGVIIPMGVERNRSIVLYDTPLREAEVETRLTNYWYPYHDRLRKELDATVQRFGHAILISLHTAHPLKQHEGDGTKPVIYLGTMNGKTCDVGLLSLLCGAMESHNALVISRDFYQGAFITQAYGQERDIHAIQIELDRRFLYIQKNQPSFSRKTQKLIAGLTDCLRAISVQGETPPTTGRRNRLGSPKSYIDPLTGEIYFS
jgi:N-formylglutamate amidohydrolase